MRFAAAWLALAATGAIPLDNAFVLDEVRWVRGSGDSVVTGRVSLALRDGTRKSCAGFPVELLPVAKYSSERIFRTYGNNESGQVLLEDKPPKFTTDAPEYHEYLLKSACDAQGAYRFEKVPSGDYYVMTFIIWDVPGSNPPAKTGGATMKRIRVAPGASLVVEHP